MFLTSYKDKQQCNRQQTAKIRCPGSENSFSKWISYKGAGNKNVAAFFPFLFVTLWLADLNPRIATQAHPIKSNVLHISRTPSKGVRNTVYVNNRPQFSIDEIKSNIRADKYNVLSK